MSEETTNKAEILANRIETYAENPEQCADELAEKLEIPASGENAEKTRNTVISFIQSYKRKAPETSDVEWLVSEFAKHPEEWKNLEELKDAAKDIVETIERYESERKKFSDHLAKGLSREGYLTKAIEEGAKANGVTDFGKYAGEIDKALDKANADNIGLMYRKDGEINRQYNLDGFIAEQHHVDTFNKDAVAKGSKIRAEVVGSHEKNSPDIIIRDENGKLVRPPYQSKYGEDAEATQKLFDKGDYRGQTKLVPEGQGNDIEGSVEVIEYDGIKSTPLSKEEAKERQRKIQEEYEAKQYEWNTVNKAAIARNIAQKAGIAALLAVGFQGARILGRRIVNFFSGKENNPIEEDVKEFVESAIKSGLTAGLTIAVTGGITVAIKSGLLGKVLKSTPVGRIANAVCIGIENVKILSQFATGEITGEEALNKAGDAMCSLVGSLALGAKGASVGAAIGTVFGPIGTAVGGVVGGMIGGIAGGAVGHAIWEGGEKIVNTVVKSFKVIAKGVSNAWNGLKNLFTIA